ASGEGTDITTSPASGGPRRPSSSAARRSTTIRPDATLGGGSARRYLSTAPPVGSCTITTASLVIARQAYRWHRRETRELHRRAGGPSTPRPLRRVPARPRRPPRGSRLPRRLGPRGTTERKVPARSDRCGQYRWSGRSTGRDPCLALVPPGI